MREDDVNDTTEMWREYRRHCQQQKQSMADHRWPRIWRLVDLHGLDTQSLGEYGLRIIGPKVSVDYWPSTGTLMIVNQPQSKRYGVSPEWAVDTARFGRVPDDEGDDDTAE